MDVGIQQASFSVGDQYTIETPTSTMLARKKIFSFRTTIELRSAIGSLIATIAAKASFRTIYSFTFVDGRTYIYRCEKLWKDVFICEGDNESFHLYPHKGFRYSIFRGDTQIASLEREPIVLGNGNSYDLRMNPDADIVVLICMVLTLNATDVVGDDVGFITFDFGKIGPEDRRFDDAWRPSDELKT